MGRRADHFQWTPERVEWMLGLVRQHGNRMPRLTQASGLRHAQVANFACRYRDAWNAATAVWRKQGAEPAPDPTPVPPPVELAPAPPPTADPIADALAARERAAALKAERLEMEAVAGERSIRATLERLVGQVVTAWPPVPAPPTLPPSPDTTEETLVLHLSDWHAYQRVSAEGTRGFNAYDAQTFAQRVYHVVQSARGIATRMQAAGWRFPRLVIALNGDLVSGTIHEVERHTDAPSIVHAVYGCGMVLAQAVRDLAETFPTVDVFCTSGNHGRLPDARRIQQDDPWRSWDTLVALFAKERLRDTPSVAWHIPQAWSVAYDVEGWRFFQTHGHDVKSWNSIPWYGLNRLITSINALEASRGRGLDVVLAGHFHNASSLSQVSGEAFINGSLIGGTTFSINALGRSDRPSQWMLGVHRTHGVTHRWPLYADHLDADAPGYAVEPWRDLAA
jgi:predicted phosphodiesterase